MIKLDKTLTELKGLPLAIGGKVIGKLDVVEHIKHTPKGDQKLYLLFVQGDRWAGEPVSETSDGFLVFMKGSLYARKAYQEAAPSKKVGSLA